MPQVLVLECSIPSPPLKGIEIMFIIFCNTRRENLRMHFCYRQNIDKPQIASISGKICTLQIPFLESGSQNCKNRVQYLTVPKSGEVRIPKLGGGKSHSWYLNSKSQYPSPPPPGSLSMGGRGER